MAMTVAITVRDTRFEIRMGVRGKENSGQLVDDTGFEPVTLRM
ncbi:MAG: hypothetical protein RIQ56_942 [Candidatus Parcubacteria bacterium]